MQKISRRQFTKRTALVSLGLPWLKPGFCVNFENSLIYIT